MEKTKEYIDPKRGLIRVFTEQTLSLIKKQSVTIAGEKLKPGDKTTLKDFFQKKVVYLGIYDELLQFKIGQKQDLFGIKVYTNEFALIDENCIVTVHQSGTARDYIFKNGKWK